MELNHRCAWNAWRDHKREPSRPSDAYEAQFYLKVHGQMMQRTEIPAGSQGSVKGHPIGQWEISTQGKERDSLFFYFFYLYVFFFFKKRGDE